jgi:hypothetical protein
MDNRERFGFKELVMQFVKVVSGEFPLTIEYPMEFFAISQMRNHQTHRKKGSDKRLMTQDSVSNIFPAFKILFGSNAFLIALINRRLASLNTIST